MKKLLINLAVLTLCVLCVSNARAALTATWDFTGQSGTGPYAGTVSGFTSASLAVANLSSGANIVTTSAGLPQPSLNMTKVNNGVLTLTLVVSQSLTMSTLSYNYQLLSGQTSGTMTWTYNINGGAAQSLSAVSVTGGTGWQSSGSINLSSISATSGQTINIIGTLAGFGGNGGDINFDNFSATSAVPEPITYALAGFGLLFVGGSAGRFYLRRKNASQIA